MKTLLSSLAAALLLSLPAYADDAHHPDQAAAKPAVKAAAAPEPLQKMQANLDKMRGQLKRIAKARSDEERQKLLAAHLQTMHENMQLGEAMAGGESCSMMEGGMGTMHEQHNSMMQRMQQMEKRMDMMQQPGQGQAMPMPAK